MILAPNRLRPEDGAIVIWTDFGNLSAPKLREIFDCTDSIKCSQFHCCFHQHYRANYDGSTFNCHLWEFLDVKKLSNSQMDARQDQLAAVVGLYQAQVTLSADKCLGCELGCWLSGETCKVCDKGIPPEWASCYACLVRSRLTYCSHVDNITHPQASASSSKSTMNKRQPGRNSAMPAQEPNLAALLEGGSPPMETLESAAVANQITPGQRRVRRALTSDSRSPFTFCSPSQTHQLLDLDSSLTLRTDVHSKLDLIIRQQGEIIRRQEHFEVQLTDMAAKISHDPMGSGTNFVNHIPSISVSDSQSTTTVQSSGVSQLTVAAESSGTDTATGTLSHQHLEALFLCSGTRSAFALQILREIFTEAEMKGKCCSGTKVKPGLDPTKLAYLKSVAFQKYPATGASPAVEGWRACVRAIDGYLRRLLNNSIQNPANPETENLIDTSTQNATSPSTENQDDTEI